MFPITGNKKWRDEDVPLFVVRVDGFVIFHLQSRAEAFQAHPEFG